MFKILVAVKGSDSCSKVAKKAEELALLCKGEVTFLTVVSSKYNLTYSKEGIDKQNENLKKVKKETEESLKTCSRVYSQCELKLGKKGLKTNRIVKEGGSPAQTICDFAKNNGYDLLIIADKAKNNLKNKLLGSNTEKIVKQSEVSVLVVK